MDGFHEEFGSHTPMAASEGSPTKRAGNDLTSNPGMPPAKRPRKLTSTIPMQDLPALTEMTTVPLMQKGQTGVQLRVFVGNKVYLLNTSSAEVMLPQGSVIAGFGKGKFKIDATEAADKIHLFQLEGSQEEVYHNNKTQRLLDTVNDRRKQEPNCKIAYHDMVVDENSDPGAFVLNIKHKIFFVPGVASEGDEEGGKLSQMSLAASVPQSVWSNCEICSIKWATKWAINGLTPIRPLVILDGDLQLGAGRAIAVTSE